MQKTLLQVAIYIAISESKEVKILMLNDSSSEEDSLDLYVERPDGKQFRIIVRYEDVQISMVRNGNYSMYRRIVDFSIAVIPLSDIDQLSECANDEDFFEAELDYTFKENAEIKEFVKSNIIDRMSLIPWSNLSIQSILMSDNAPIQ